MKALMGILGIMGVMAVTAEVVDLTPRDGTNVWGDPGITMRTVRDIHQTELRCVTTNGDTLAVLEVRREFKAAEQSVFYAGVVILQSGATYDLKRAVVFKGPAKTVEVDGYDMEPKEKDGKVVDMNVILEIPFETLRWICASKSMVIDGFERSAEFDLSGSRELLTKFWNTVAGDGKYVARSQTSKTSQTVEEGTAINLSRTVATPGVSILNPTMRVTEKNAVYWQCAFQLTVKNSTDSSVKGDVIVQFTDRDGFVVDDRTEHDVIVGPRQSKVISNYDLVSSGPAGTIARVQAHWKPGRF